jgi:hypothetical protein
LRITALSLGRPSLKLRNADFAARVAWSRSSASRMGACCTLSMPAEALSLGVDHRSSHAIIAHHRGRGPSLAGDSPGPGRGPPLSRARSPLSRGRGPPSLAGAVLSRGRGPSLAGAVLSRVPPPQTHPSAFCTLLTRAPSPPNLVSMCSYPRSR